MDYPAYDPKSANTPLTEDELATFDDLLTNLPRGAGNEIQLTDGIARLLDHEFVLAHAFDGIRYDCGSKLGYLEATLAFGLNHPETGAEFRILLKQYADKF